MDRAQKYDAIFFDTYSEDWIEQRRFHELLPKLLKPGGMYSFFNGFCPDNIFFQGVACQVRCLLLYDPHPTLWDSTVFRCKVIQVELEGMGISSQFHQVQIDCR